MSQIVMTVDYPKSSDCYFFLYFTQYELEQVKNDQTVTWKKLKKYTYKEKNELAKFVNFDGRK
jgi:hypothetical protein